MLRLSPFLIQTAGFLIGDRHDRASGRGAIGTFFLIQESHTGFDYTEDADVKKFMVTARHVIERERGAVEAIMLNSHTETASTWDATDGWRYPDDASGSEEDPRVDLAIRALTVHDSTGFRAIPVDFRIENAARSAQNLSELGRTVYYAGLLDWTERLADEAIPVVRSGTLAALWKQGIDWQHPWPDVDGLPLDRYWTSPETHLIDVRSYGGFSGSPAFIQFFAPHPDKWGDWPDIWWEWARQTQEAQADDPNWADKLGSLQTFTHWFGMYAAFDKERGIGCVVPSGYITDFLRDVTAAEYG